MQFNVTGFLGSSSPESGVNDNSLLKISLGQKYKVSLRWSNHTSVSLIVCRFLRMQRKPAIQHRRQRTRRSCLHLRLRKLMEVTAKMITYPTRIPCRTPLLTRSHPTVSIFAPCTYIYLQLTCCDSIQFQRSNWARTTHYPYSPITGEHFSSNSMQNWSNLIYAMATATLSLLGICTISCGLAPSWSLRELWFAGIFSVDKTAWIKR